MSAFSFSVTRNDIAPALSNMASAARRPEPVFRAMGTTLLSLTMGNFKSANAAFRPTPWPPKKDGTPATLQQSGTLSRSFHLSVTNTYAKVSNPMVYARRHQLGDEGGKPIPPRPFFPVDSSGKLTPQAYDLIAKAGHRALARQFWE